MKKLIFGLMATGIVVLSSFTMLTEKNEAVFRTVDCKWRTCYVINGNTACTEWTTGNCNQTDSGTLIPIKGIN